MHLVLIESQGKLLPWKIGSQILETSMVRFASILIFKCNRY